MSDLSKRSIKEKSLEKEKIQSPSSIPRRGPRAALASRDPSRPRATAGARKKERATFYKKTKTALSGDEKRRGRFARITQSKTPPPHPQKNPKKNPLVGEGGRLEKEKERSIPAGRRAYLLGEGGGRGSLP